MNGVSFPRLQRIDYRFKWVKEGVAAKLVSRGLLRANAGSLCRLQPLAQEQSRIVYRVHQSRCRGGSRSDSDPSKRNPVVTKQSHFTNVLIGWSVVTSTAVAAMP